MAANSYLTKGQPQFSDSAAPDTAVDPSLVAQYAGHVGNRVVGTAAQRAAFTGIWAGFSSGPWAGCEFFETDTGLLYVYMSGAWRDARGWAFPSSVAGTGVSLTGWKVIASGASDISVNGCFTAASDWYDITYDLTCSAAATLALQFRASGTNAATAYDFQANATVNATNFPAQSLNQTSIALDAQGLAGKHNGTIRVFNPFQSVATTGTTLTGGSANPMTSITGVVQTMFFSHRTASAYDGFTILRSTGTVSGTVTVKGI